MLTMGGRAFPLVSRCHSSVVKEKREGLIEGSERSPWSHPVTIALRLCDTQSISVHWLGGHGGAQ
jgi:hypothetical protein